MGKRKYKTGEFVRAKSGHLYLEYGKVYQIEEACTCDECGDHTYCIDFGKDLPHVNYNGEEIYTKCKICNAELGCESESHVWPSEEEIIGVNETGDHYEIF